MIKYLFVYGILINNFTNLACKVKPAIAYGIKLAIHKIDLIPAIIPTYEIHDYVNGQAIKICNPNKIAELFEICDQIAFGFNKKIIQITVGDKKVEAYAYFPNEFSMYDEVEYHSYSEYKAKIKN